MTTPKRVPVGRGVARFDAYNDAVEVYCEVERTLGDGGFNAYRSRRVVELADGTKLATEWQKHEIQYVG